jgi:hypothetical protein
MSAFSDQVRAFAKDTERDLGQIHTNTVIELRRSWVEGSELTGAPPLPIAQERSATRGKLRQGVRVNYIDEHNALIFTTVGYAEEVEDNLRGVTFSEGGPHGMKLTVAGAGRIVEHVAQRTAGFRK